MGETKEDAEETVGKKTRFAKEEEKREETRIPGVTVSVIKVIEGDMPKTKREFHMLLKVITAYGPPQDRQKMIEELTSDAGVQKMMGAEIARYQVGGSSGSGAGAGAAVGASPARAGAAVGTESSGAGANVGGNPASADKRTGGSPAPAGANIGGSPAPADESSLTPLRNQWSDEARGIAEQFVVPEDKADSYGWIRQVTLATPWHKKGKDVYNSAKEMILDIVEDRKV